MRRLKKIHSGGNQTQRLHGVKWSRTADGLSIELPGTLPGKSALCVRVTGLTTVAGLSPDTLAAFKNKLNTLPAPAQ